MYQSYPPDASIDRPSAGFLYPIRFEIDGDGVDGSPSCSQTQGWHLYSVVDHYAMALQECGAIGGEGTITV